MTEMIEEYLRTVANPMVGLLITTLVLFYTWNWPGSRRRDMPPGAFVFPVNRHIWMKVLRCDILSGPQPLPIIGNLLNLKPTRVYEQSVTLCVMHRF